MDYIANINSLKSLYNEKKINLFHLKKFIKADRSLDEMTSLHCFLISQIMAITDNENSSANEKISSSSLNCTAILKDSEDKKSAGKMYFFNDDSEETYIFGDIHNDYQSIIKFLRKINFTHKINHNIDTRLIFLGDYIDRGHAPYKTIETVLLLKYLFPENIFLLRGNHDGGSILENGTYKLCVGRNDGTTDDDYFVAKTYNMLKKSGRSLELLDTYLKFFYSLCTLALIKNGKETVLCVHGGIPRPSEKAANSYDYLNSVSDLWNNNILDRLDDTVTFNMLWSDPSEDRALVRNTRRFYFYKEDFDIFTSRLSIDKIIRGHEAFEAGYKEFFDGRLISIFSSGKSGICNSETAYPDITPCILKLKKGSYTVVRI